MGLDNVVEDNVHIEWKMPWERREETQGCNTDTGALLASIFGGEVMQKKVAFRGGASLNTIVQPEFCNWFFKLS